MGNKLYFLDKKGNEILVAEVVDNTTSRGRTIRFLFDGTDEEFSSLLRSQGQTPLPKYINRKAEEHPHTTPTHNITPENTQNTSPSFSIRYVRDELLANIVSRLR